MTDPRATTSRSDTAGARAAPEQGSGGDGRVTSPAASVVAPERGSARPAAEATGRRTGPATLKVKMWRSVASRGLWRGILGLIAFVVVWEVLASLDLWIGVTAPIVGDLPKPSEVAVAVGAMLGDQGFYWSALASFRRVMLGFIWAMAIGIPFGLLLATSKIAKDIFFPPFEVLRPIPPLAWVPASIIFWPTQEVSIAFVTFIGAFYTVVLNTVGGGEQIDRRYKLAARSMGASGFTVFRRVVLPGTLPSISTGAVVGMGITWEVVVAAEMISGGGQGAMAGSGGGLGFTIWNSYLGGAIPQVIVGMVALGLLGYLSSGVVRYLGRKAMPWKAKL